MVDNGAVEQKLAQLEDLLAQLEGTPGPMSDLALDAIALLSAVYGEALARVVSRVSGCPEVLSDLTADELLGHLFVLHGVSPTPLGERIAAALDSLRPHLAGAKVQLLDVAGSRAQVEVSGKLHGCSSSAAELKDAVVATLLAAAPELVDVDVITLPDVPEPTLIPAESLFRSQRVPM